MEKIRKAIKNPGIRSLPSTLQYPFKEKTIMKLKEIISQDLIGHLQVSLSVLQLDVAEAQHCTNQNRFSETNSNIKNTRDLASSRFMDIEDGMSKVASGVATLQIEDRKSKVFKWISGLESTQARHRIICEQREAVSCPNSSIATPPFQRVG